MTQGRCDYVDSVFGGSLKQVNLLAGAAWTPGACHSLPNQPLITGGAGRGWLGGCQSDTSLGELAGRFRQTCTAFQSRERRLKLGWE